jgi:hypothetical protein
MKGMLPIVVVFGLFGTALQATAAVEARARWQYDNGQFEQLTGSNWLETDDTGGRAEFREVTRNMDYIELYDQSRDIAVRLYARQMYLKQPGEQQFQYFRNGQWCR